MKKYFILLLVVGLIGLTSIVGAEKPEKITILHCTPSDNCNVIDVGSMSAALAHINNHNDCILSDSETEVPFVPSGDRPVYCREYTKHKPARY